MPRIEASSIEEHVSKQTARILDAAIVIFRKNGYQATDMRQLAEAVGLARNSLYRYYPSKDSILLACLERDMQPVREKLEALEESVPDARARVDAWLDLQMEIAGGICHEFMPMVEDIRRNSPELSSEILGLHRDMDVILGRAVAELLQDTLRQADLVTDMIGAMIRTTAGRVMASGHRTAAMQELKESVSRILDTPVQRPGDWAEGDSDD